MHSQWGNLYGQYAEYVNQARPFARPERDVNPRPVPHPGRRLQPVDTDTGTAVRNAVELGRVDPGTIVYVPPWVAEGPGGFFRVLD